MHSNRIGRRGGIGKSFQPWRVNQNRQHNEHDDRKSGGEVKRRVTFKPTGRGRGNAGIRLSDVRIRAHLEGDEDMGGHDDMHSGMGNRPGTTKGDVKNTCL